MDLPLKIGLTGGIAAGKTTVSNLFAKLGVPIIDADVIAHTLVKPGQPALELIAQTFGFEIINFNGELNRAKLRKKIFANDQQRQRLESILHPRIYQVMQEKVAALSVPYCVLSIPLLLETHYKERLDRVLVIDCPPNLQRLRLLSRPGLSQIEIEQMIKAQASREARLAIANDVIYNQTDLENLQQEVLVLHQRYEKQARSINTTPITNNKS
ncbi:MAG: dephospho-CoA kinase [Candidatus Parabeggiatoa sp.]|nr:dephospho-CoA kinase [Candidatus Parabeggiatoa sp.]